MPRLIFSSGSNVNNNCALFLFKQQFLLGDQLDLQYGPIMAQISTVSPIPIQDKVKGILQDLLQSNIVWYKGPAYMWKLLML